MVGRVDDCARFENESTPSGTEGSNPSPSAISHIPERIRNIHTGREYPLREGARLYTQEQLTMREVAQRLGGREAMWRTMLAEAGIKIRHVGVRNKDGKFNVITPEMVKEMVRLYVDEGKTLVQIGAALNLHRSTVQREVKKAGVPLRPSYDIGKHRQKQILEKRLRDLDLSGDVTER